MTAPDTTVYQFNISEQSIGLLDNIYATSASEGAELLEAYRTDVLPERVAVAVAVKAAAAAAAGQIVSQNQSVPAPQQNAAPAFTQQQAPAAAPAAQHICGCGIPMTLRPAGVSKKTGKPYSGFYTCANGQQGCGQTRNL